VVDEVRTCILHGTSLHGAAVESYVSDARGYDVNGDMTGYVEKVR
jgi:hypothetical protein